MAWRVKHDRDAFKEVWLLFGNEHGHFPLYPGESRWIEYGYTVSDSKWGNWFQRAVRLPTERLSVQLQFPAELDPAVWGMETSMTAEAHPFRTAIEQEERDGYRVFSWATDNPAAARPLPSRMELPARVGREPPPVSDLKPSEKMAGIGIVQKGDPILRKSRCTPRPSSRGRGRPASHRRAARQNSPGRYHSQLQHGPRRRRTSARNPSRCCDFRTELRAWSATKWTI